MIDFLDLIGQGELPREETSAGVPARSGLARLRANHHLLARKLAEGAEVCAASALTGYSPETIRTLKQDPTFQELLAYYQAQVEPLIVSVEDRLAALCGSFLDEIQHRLETQPEKFSDDQLRKMFEAFADRSVAPSKARAGGPSVGAPAGVAIKIDFVQAPAARVHPILDLSPAE